MRRDERRAGRAPAEAVQHADTRAPQPVPDRSGLSADAVLALQRGAGNAAVARHLRLAASAEPMPARSPATDAVALMRSSRGVPSQAAVRSLARRSRGRSPKDILDDILEHFESDWAGRALLLHYLQGGRTLRITDDARWSKYMKANDEIRRNVDGFVRQKARHTVADYKRSGSVGECFGERKKMDLAESFGEGITGYQYMHGTNANVGGFGFAGQADLKRAGGGYKVVVQGRYTWNDVIDKNPKYVTDRVKNVVAELITRGKADPYDLHLTWSATATVTVDRGGRVRSVDGYPGRGW